MIPVLLLIGIVLLLLILYVFALICKPRKKDFYGLAAYHYAHRGLHSKAVPENSLTAFRLAAEAGYGAELDVHLTKDGKLAVMHDESLLRTVGVDKLLCDCTATELRELHLKNSKEPIPFLEEVLPLFAGKSPLIIELKCYRGNYKALTDAVCTLLAWYPNVQFCMESFDPRAIRYLRKHYPQIIRGQLACRFSKDSGPQGGLSFVLRYLLLNFLTVPHFVAYCHTNRRNLSLWICRKLWRVQEFSWTVRSAQEAQMPLREGACIIFENFKP